LLSFPSRTASSRTFFALTSRGISSGVADEVIGNVTKMLRGEYGIRELVQDRG
jgi:hypothetical protein